MVGDGASVNAPTPMMPDVGGGVAGFGLSPGLETESCRWAFGALWSETSTVAGGLEARRTRLAPRPAGGGARLAVGTVRGSHLDQRWAARGSRWERYAARTSTSGGGARLAVGTARGSHLDQRWDRVEVRIGARRGYRLRMSMGRPSAGVGPVPYSRSRR
ncbi:hypothetical protein CJJ17_18310 [Gordonia polyisoprenivorans]|nr:hypothetical protein CJJ17_18310 [Gordonia polyisoprenivorans]